MNKSPEGLTLKSISIEGLESCPKLGKGLASGCFLYLRLSIEKIYLGFLLKARDKG